MKYCFIAKHKKVWPIDLMCKVLGVTRSGFYHNQKQQAVKEDDPERSELLEWVKKISESSDYTYGGRRMKKALNALGYPLSRNKAKKLMNEAGVFVRYIPIQLEGTGFIV